MRKSFAAHGDVFILIASYCQFIIDIHPLSADSRDQARFILFFDRLHEGDELEQLFTDWQVFTLFIAPRSLSRDYYIK